MHHFLAQLEAIAGGHPTEAYLILCLSAFVENIFPPIPGDTVIVFGAYLVGRGALAVRPVVWATFVGSSAGFMTWYVLGRTLGRSALMRLAWVRKSERRIESAERLARRHGVFVVLANRFMPGMRSVVSITAGLLRMPFWYVFPAAMVSVFVWNGLLIWGGRVAGQNWEEVVEVINRYNYWFGIALVVGAIFLATGWLSLRGRREKARKNEGGTRVPPRAERSPRRPVLPSASEGTSTMNLHLYNSLTRTKEKFEPISPGHVGIYVCGPTVYGDSHLGHAKSYVCFDVVVRYMRFLGFKVRYVQNITDVGHMTDNDEDQGEDKIAKEAALEHTEPMEVVTHYMMSYFEDMAALNVRTPDIICQASGHIPEQIALVNELLEKGYAYEANGSVYFSVKSFRDYGKLSGRRVEELEGSGRIETNPEKRNPADFALWKRAEPEHLMRWDSPWGEGFPGWHVECSAMSMKYLGETFDIHGGGLENQFPHHECEIAQSEAATGKPFAKYWLHNNMLTINGTKMGKSLGNFVTIKEMFRKVSPQTLRLFILMSHYRSVTDFSDEALSAAEKGMARLTSAVQALDRRMATASDGGTDPELEREIVAIRDRFLAVMDDDFNSAEAIAELFNLVRVINRALTSDEPVTRRTLALVRTAMRELAEEVLGLQFTKESTASDEQLDRVVQVLVNLRQQLRKEKQFALADEIRQKLCAVGIQLKDERDRTTWSRVV